MSEFADEAGITKRTLYKYVNSKEELVENALLSFIKDVQGRLSDELKQSKNFQSIFEKIIEIYPTLITKINSKVIKEIFVQYPAVEESVIRERNNLVQDINMYIKDAQNNGIVDEAFGSEMILEALQALVIFYMKHSENDLEEKIKKSFSMMLYGIIKNEKEI